MSNSRQSALSIEESILRRGYHLRFIDGGPMPRFAYTIGLFGTLGFEFAFAGAELYSLDDVERIVAAAVGSRRDAGSLDDLRTEQFGALSFGRIDPSWSSPIFVGAAAFHSVGMIPGVQIFPDKDQWTIDIPNMSRGFRGGEEPIWRWIDPDVDVPPTKRTAITNVDALRGYCVTEAMRWSETEWELFSGSGPEVPKNEIRQVSLDTLLGFDRSLTVLNNLPVNTGVYRGDVNEPWIDWRPQGNAS